jgi:hypothetical protein
MARKRAAPGSSLELLLDTICNTFGGVVFIAILIVVLLQLTGTGSPNASPGAVQPQAAADLHQRLQASLARLKSLRAAAAHQQSLLSDLDAKAPKGLADEIHALQLQRDDLHDQRLQRIAELSKARLETNALNTKQAELDRRVAELRVKLAAAQKNLQAETSARTEDAKLPELRDTNKLEIPLLLCNGRLCFLYRPKADGEIVLNSEECSMTGAQREVAPLPGKGLEIHAAGGDGDKITARLKQFDKGEYYIAVFVWPDSFALFRHVRDNIVNAGFEYRLVPVAAGGKVYMGVSASMPVKVQ